MSIADPSFILVAVLVGVLAAAPGLAALALQARAFGRRLDAVESAQLKEASDRGKLQQEVEELRRGIGVLLGQLRRAGMTPEWSPPPPLPEPPLDMAQVRQDELVSLSERIAECFDLDEQADLWFRLGFSDGLRGETLESRARNLVLYAKRRRKLDELRRLAREERPDEGF